MDPTTPAAPLPVVVGVDGSARAAEALRTGARLRVVTVWNVPAAAAWGPVATPTADPEVFREAAAEAAEAAAGAARAAGLADDDVDVELRNGAAAPELLAAAEGASCLVLGTHGRGRLARAVLGSVSTACAHHTPVPLVVVGDGAVRGAGHAVVVGFDGSPSSRAAVAWAARHARSLGVGLRVVHVWASALGEAAEVAVAGPTVTDPTPAVEQAVVDVLDGAGVEERPPVTVDVVTGNAGRALVAAADGAAALVVGRRGLGGFAGLLLGSVAHSALHHSDGPVVVVPPPDDDVA